VEKVKIKAFYCLTIFSGLSIFCKNLFVRIKSHLSFLSLAPRALREFLGLKKPEVYHSIKLCLHLCLLKGSHNLFSLLCPGTCIQATICKKEKQTSSPNKNQKTTTKTKQKQLKNPRNISFRKKHPLLYMAAKIHLMVTSDSCPMNLISFITSNFTHFDLLDLAVCSQAQTVSASYLQFIFSPCSIFSSKL